MGYLLLVAAYSFGVVLVIKPDSLGKNDKEKDPRYNRQTGFILIGYGVVLTLLNVQKLRSWLIMNMGYDVFYPLVLLSIMALLITQITFYLLHKKDDQQK